MSLFRPFFMPFSLHKNPYVPQPAQKNHQKIAYNNSYQ